MRQIRGLYLIRSGAAAPRLSAVRDNGDGGDNGDSADGGEGEGGEGEAADDGRLATLEVDFSRFDTWYEIDSFWEGRFLERVTKGAFKRTIDAAKRDDGTFSTKILFNHGFDMYVHDKVLGVPEMLEERDDSPHMEAGLLDTSYNRDLLPGLRAGAYGSSFMFEVMRDEWDHEPQASDDNPDGLPERTVTEVRLYEAGPVTWPANPEATAGVRSGTDWYAEQVQQRDQDRYDELVRSFAAFRALHGLGTPQGFATPAASEPETPAPGTGPARHVDGAGHAAARARRLQLIDMARS